MTAIAALPDSSSTQSSPALRAVAVVTMLHEQGAGQFAVRDSSAVCPSCDEPSTD